MKKTILFSSLVALALTASAQVDITPEHFKFQNWPVGALSTEANAINAIDEVAKGQVASGKSPLLNTNGGSIRLQQWSFSDPAHVDVDRVKSGLSIVDLGGTAGKVLCFKGNEATYEKATIKASEKLTVPEFSLAFYPDPTTTKTGLEVFNQDNPGTSIPFDANNTEANTSRLNAIVRTTVIFKIVDNDIDYEAGENRGVRFQITTGNGNPGAKGEFSTKSFAKYAEDQETGDMTGAYIKDRWIQLTTDGYMNKGGQQPYAFNMTLSTVADKITKKEFGINKKTVLIKSIKMTTGYRVGSSSDFYTSVTDPILPTDFNAANANAKLPLRDAFVTYSEGASGIDAIENANKPFYSVSGNQVTLDNLVEGDAVAIYSVGGQPVDSFVAKSNTAILSLQKGYYLAKIGKETLKLVVY